MLAIGDRAPDFSATDDTGRRWTLAELLAEGEFVLYFYPADFTPVCTREACMFRDVYPDLADAGVRIFGVSPQGEGSHRSFREKHRLPFPLLADTNKSLTTRFGAQGPLGMGVRRVSYLIDAEGRIADLVVADLRVGRHEAFVRRVLDRHARRRN